MEDEGKGVSSPDPHSLLYPPSLCLVSHGEQQGGKTTFISKTGQNEAQDLDWMGFVSVPINISSKFSWSQCSLLCKVRSVCYIHGKTIMVRGRRWRKGVGE